MQVLILYFSKGGNTRKLAEAVARGVEEVEGVSALLKNTSEVTKEDFVECEGLIVGSPVYFGLMTAEVKKVFDEFIVFFLREHYFSIKTHAPNKSE